jgi:Flp pilus assembly pilin Flp
MLSRTLTYIRRFRLDESGAVTVDWVVLTAAVVGLALATLYYIQTMATDPAESLGAYLGNHRIQATF